MACWQTRARARTRVSFNERERVEVLENMGSRGSAEAEIGGVVAAFGPGGQRVDGCGAEVVLRPLHMLPVAI